MRSAQLSLIASALIFSLAALGQTAPQPPQTSELPTLKVFTREVVVDIIVTGNRGQAIRNLKQSDFTILEDGKPQPIRSFSETGPEDSAPVRAQPTLPSQVRTNLQAAPNGGNVNVVLIDALHLNFTGADRAMQAVSAYAMAMPPGTQLAVFWLGASGLHMLQSFTTDPAAVQQALGVHRTDIGFNSDCYGADRVTIDALNQIATYVAGIKGRKNLIWVTPNVPVFLLRDGGYSWGTNTACHNADTQRAFGANRGNGPSLFTGPDGQTTEGVDMSMVHRLMDTYEVFSSEQIAVSPLNPNGVGPLSGMNLVAEQVAQQSGGYAEYNSNNLTGEFADIIDKSSHYYTVSYIPPRRKDDGHYHTIKVQLNVLGAHLVYRQGYNAEDPKQPRQFSGPDLIKAALEGKSPAASQIVFDARLSPSKTPLPPPPATKPKGKPERPRNAYDLYLAVPQNQIAYTKSPDGTRAVNLQFAFDAYDLNGKLLGSHSQNVALNMALDKFSQFVLEPVIFHEQLAFFPGPLFLRVGILDHVSNRVGTLEIPLTVPKSTQ